MAYKNDLQLAYSGREISLQSIEVIDSTVFDDQAARNSSKAKAKRKKYQRLLEKSDEKIAEIKSRITEDIAAKKLQLEESKTEYNHVSTRYKLGKISLQECEEQQNSLQKKYDRIKQDAVELNQLLDTSRSSEIGGQIPIDIETEVDGYGNINRKMAGLNIPNAIKTPNNEVFSNIKRSNFNSTSNITDPVSNAFSNVNIPNNISTQGMNISRNSLILLACAIGGLLVIVAVLFVAYVVVTAIAGGFVNSSADGFIDSFVAAFVDAIVHSFIDSLIDSFLNSLFE
jgi:hypothetical protein